MQQRLHTWYIKCGFPNMCRAVLLSQAEMWTLHMRGDPNPLDLKTAFGSAGIPGGSTLVLERAASAKGATGSSVIAEEPEPHVAGSDPGRAETSQQSKPGAGSRRQAPSDASAKVRVGLDTGDGRLAGIFSPDTSLLAMLLAL